MAFQLQIPIHAGHRRASFPRAVVLLVAMMAIARAACAAEDPVVEQLRKASAAYADAYNKKDFKALADQWSAKAELLEGRSRLEGREAIVASIRAWRERHPEAALQVVVGDVDVLAEPLARVTGVMRFTRRPGEKPIESRFSSLRVLEGDTWRLAESLVAPAHAAALDDLDWVLGTWRSEGTASPAVEVVYEKTVGGYCILGRTKIKPKTGKERDILQVIHADRATGLVKTWIFDSSGARAEGVVKADGASYHQSLVGTPAEGAGGTVARWVQVIAPAGDGKFSLHAIERTLDGKPLPDGQPLDFRKVR